MHTSGVLKFNSKVASNLTYVDLAANDAQINSNTFFFDRCLNFNGICIEPNPIYHLGIRAKRKCHLVPTCVADVEKTIDFVMSGPLGHMIEPVRQHAPKPGSSRMRCSTLRGLLKERQMFHVNYMSLDIEGAELSALKSVNWQRTTFDVITVENSNRELRDFLHTVGMVPALCVSLDTVYVRAGDVQRAAAKWYASHGQRLLPACVTDRTESCIGSPESFLRCQAAKRKPGRLLSWLGTNGSNHHMKR